MVNRVKNITRNPDLMTSIVVILILNLITLYPVLVSGWYYDDYIHSYIRGTIGIEGLDLLQFMKTRLGYWLKDGRFYPISTLYYLIYWLFSYPVYLLKFVYILGTMFASISYYFFIRKVSNSFWFALLPIALLPIIFQYHSYHDPRSTYSLPFANASYLYTINRFNAFISLLFYGCQEILSVIGHKCSVIFYFFVNL